MKTLLFLLVGLTAIGSIACFGISQEALQSALDEQAAAAQRQADTPAQTHVQELADNDAAASARIADVQESLVQAKLQAVGLQDQLTTANSDASATKDQLASERVQVDNLAAQLETNLGETKAIKDQVAAERAQVADLEDQVAAERAQVADLEDQVAAERAQVADLQEQLASAGGDAGTVATQLNAEISRLTSQLSAAKRETTRARDETRWVSVLISGAPSLYGITPDANDIRGLMVQCKNDGATRLYVWDNYSYQPGAYSTQAGFDDDRLRKESLQAFDSDAMLFFTDISASELWQAKTFTIKDAIAAHTFDTTQLRRMFPTKKAFCDGEQPKSN